MQMQRNPCVLLTRLCYTIHGSPRSLKKCALCGLPQAQVAKFCPPKLACDCLFALSIAPVLPHQKRHHECRMRCAWNDAASGVVQGARCGGKAPQLCRVFTRTAVPDPLSCSKSSSCQCDSSKSKVGREPLQHLQRPTGVVPLSTLVNQYIHGATPWNKRRLIFCHMMILEQLRLNSKLSWHDTRSCNRPCPLVTGLGAPHLGPRWLIHTRDDTPQDVGTGQLQCGSI